MFRLRLKLLIAKGQRDIAEAHLEGAWRALSKVLCPYDAALIILREIDRSQWYLIPKSMTEFILEHFNANYDQVVPGEHREQSDNIPQP